MQHLEKTARQVAARLAADWPEAPPVTHILAAVANHPSSSSGGGPGPTNVAASGGHLGEVTMQLTPGQNRNIETREVGNIWRETSGPIADAVEPRIRS